MLASPHGSSRSGLGGIVEHARTARPAPGPDTRCHAGDRGYGPAGDLGCRHRHHGGLEPIAVLCGLGRFLHVWPGPPAQLGPQTNPPAPAACQRSSDNYPTIVAKSLGVAVDDVSCLGASTKDLDASQGSGIPAQLSALGPSTSLVSLGIGGNDLGFSSVVANCAAVTPWGATKVGWSCRSHYTVNGVDELVSLVHQVGDRVAALLTDVGPGRRKPGCSSSGIQTSSRPVAGAAGPCSRSCHRTSTMSAASRRT